jgi:hypothetical protein
MQNRKVPVSLIVILNQTPNPGVLGLLRHASAPKLVWEPSFTPMKNL